uniref:hypothetical protein n=1 Tax=Candidatus Electronema sp. TaxID=2698783 RepID=UPI004056DBDE
MSDNYVVEKITAKDQLGDLRNEIVESEKSRMDFLKYKLIVIASLGAIGLGFSEQHTNAKIEPDYILCIIPFICAYVDLLCYHNTIRILVIACFLDYNNDPYEGYIGQLDHNNPYGGARYLFNMEDFVLHWSSIAISFFLFSYSLIPFLNNLKIKGIIFLLVGAIAIIVNFSTKLSFKRHQDVLFATAEKIKKGCAQ